MTRKQMKITAGLYVFCALVWTLNFFIHWYTDGCLELSTILFGVAAVCFIISAVLNIIRIRRIKNTKEE